MRYKIKHYLLMVIMLAVVLPVLIVTAFAATTVVPITCCVSVTDSVGNGKLSNGTVTIQASGGLFSQKTNTVTITNSSSSKAKITFDYSASNYSSFSEGSDSGEKELVLEAGGTGTMTIKGKKAISSNTATLTLSNFTYTAIGDATNATMSYTASLGSVTAGGATVSNEGTFEIPSDGVAMVAAPNSGAEFVGWMNPDDNTVLSTDASFTLLPISGLSAVQAVFETKGTGAGWYLAGEEKMYNDFSTAVTYAASASKKTVILLNSGTMATGTYNVPNEVTFLVPYAAGKYTINATTTTDESGGLASTLEHANVTFVTQDSEGKNGGTVTGVMEPNTAVTYTLTIPSGTILNIKSGGKLVVGGTVVAGTVSTTGICGATAGAHSNIQLDGTINVNSGGILSTCGYILGNGTVNAASSGTVYQPYIMMDHKDGHYLYGAKEEEYFPFNRHAIMNIRTKFVLSSGADMYGYVAFFTKANTATKAQFNVTSIHVVGSGSEEALYLLGGTMTMTYDSSKILSVTSSTDNNSKGYYNKVGRTTVVFDGNASLGYITLSLRVVGSTYNMSSATSVFPLSYNYNIIQKSGTFTVANDMALLPGATFTVADGAAMTISSGKKLVVYDGLRDYAQRSESVTIDNSANNGSGTWPRYHYPSSANLKSAGFSSTAELIMNGTLTVNGNLGGTIQTNGTTGKIVMGTNAGNSAGTQFGVINKTFELKIFAAKFTIAGSSGKTERTLSAKAFTGNTSVPTMTLQAGKTYVATGNETNSITSYTYGVYTTHDASSATPETKTDLDAVVIGTWKCETCSYEAAVTAPTCTMGGYTTYTCSVCGYSYAGNETAALGHDWDQSTGNCTRGDAQCAAKIVGGQYYPTLADAVNEAATKAQIQMCTDSEETNCVIDKVIYLDLNGKKVTGKVTLSATLYGADSSSDGFKTPGGSITVSGSTVAAVANNVNGKDYVANVESSTDTTTTYSFYRFAIMPTAYQFYFSPNNGHSHLGFAATVRCSDADVLKAHLVDVGFTATTGTEIFDLGNVSWYKEEQSNGTLPGNLEWISCILLDLEESDFGTSYTPIAAAAFDSGRTSVITGTAGSISLYQALSLYVQENPNSDVTAFIKANVSADKLS